MLKQEFKRPVHLLGVDQVVVIEDQHRLVLAGPGGQLVDQRRHQPLERRRRRRPEQRADPLGGSWPCPVQSASSAVLPNPAGAQTRISRRASPSSSASASRGRGTKPRCGRGTCNLVASSTSGPGAATPAGAATGGSAIGDPPLSAASNGQPRYWMRTF